MAISQLSTQAARLAAQLAKNKASLKKVASGALWVAENTRALEEVFENIQTRKSKRAGAKESSEAEREARALALDLARQQVDAQWSEGIVVDGARRCVVWRGGKPIACFPALDGNPPPAELARRPELLGLEPSLITDPPPRTNA